MDRHGLLTLARTLAMTFSNVSQARISQSHIWDWVAIPLIQPETICPFCKESVRSSGVWFLDNTDVTLPTRYDKLRGAIFPSRSGKVELVHPSHPHDTGNGVLCLGGHSTGFNLFASMPNLHDTPMGAYHIPRWLKRYWRHDCKDMREYLNHNGYRDQLRELDGIRGV